MFDKLSRIYFDKFLCSETHLVKKIFVNYFARYYSLIKTGSAEEKAEVIAACFSLFITSILTQLYLKTSVSFTKHFHYFTMVGILDNIMDNSIASKVERIKKVQMVYNIIYANDKPTDPSMHIFYEIWNQADERLKETIKFCYNDACRSFIEQYDTNDEEVLKRACMEAGRNTFMLLFAVHGIEVDKEETNKLGYCLQTCDNIVDIHDDIRDNIKTNVTFVYQRDGHLDSLIFELIQIVTDIKISFYKFICILCLNYAIYNSDLFTSKVKRYIRGELLLTRKKHIGVIMGTSLNNMIVRVLKEQGHKQN